MADSKSFLTYEDYILRKKENDDSLISVNTALKRLEIAEENGEIEKTVASKYWWTIWQLNFIYKEKLTASNKSVFSYQDLLRTHFEKMLEENFNFFQKIQNMPSLNYQKAMQESIITYVDNMSMFDDNGKLYTSKDLTEVEVLGEYLERYYSAYKDTIDRKRTPMPDDVCEYIENIGYMADRVEFVDTTGKNDDDIIDFDDYGKGL